MITSAAGAPTDATSQAPERRIAARHAKTAIEQWQEGKDFLYVRDQRLYMQDGYRSMAVWVEEVLGRSSRTVSRRMAFTESVALKDLQTWEPDLLDLALEYVALSRQDGDDVLNPRTLVVAVPREGGRLDSVPFRKITVTQMRAALDHQRALRARRQDDALGDEPRQLVEALSRAVATETGALAKVVARPAKSGLPEDTLVKIDFRMGDLRSVVTRLQQLVAQQERPRSRRR